MACPASISAAGQRKNQSQVPQLAHTSVLHTVVGALHILSLIFPTALQEKYYCQKAGEEKKKNQKKTERFKKMSNIRKLVNASWPGCLAPKPGIYASFMYSVMSDCAPMNCSLPGSSIHLGLSSQEYWSGLPFPPPGDLPNPGIQHKSAASPALVDGFFTTEPPGKPMEYTLHSPKAESLLLLSL